VNIALALSLLATTASATGIMLIFVWAMLKVGGNTR
jgi:hypothetical protein